jgi:hypothetical protein
LRRCPLSLSRHGSEPYTVLNRRTAQTKDLKKEILPKTGAACSILSKCHRNSPKSSNLVMDKLENRTQTADLIASRNQRPNFFLQGPPTNQHGERGSVPANHRTPSVAANPRTPSRNITAEEAVRGGRDSIPPANHRTPNRNITPGEGGTRYHQLIQELKAVSNTEIERQMHACMHANSGER